MVHQRRKWPREDPVKRVAAKQQRQNPKNPPKERKKKLLMNHPKELLIKTSFKRVCVLSMYLVNVKLAAALKEEGNNAYKNKDYELAIQVFTSFGIMFHSFFYCVSRCSDIYLFRMLMYLCRNTRKLWLLRMLMHMCFTATEVLPTWHSRNTTWLKLMHKSALRLNPCGQR